MIDKTTSRVILGLLGTACILITAFAWYKTQPCRLSGCRDAP